MNRISALVLAYFVLTTLVRAVLFATVVPGEGASGTEVYAVWLTGAVNDLVVLAILALPVLVVRVAWPRALAVVITAAAVVGGVFALLDLFFWFEFGNRADRLVFHYLRFPIEVGYFLEDQFFLSLYAVPVLLVLLALHRASRHVARAVLATSTTACAWAATVLSVGLATTVAFVAEPGALRATSSRVLNAVASHGLLDVAHAALVDEEAWRGVFPELPAADRAALLVAPAAAAPALAPRHLVLVIEESFAGETWWDPAERARYMPRFDALRQRGLYFESHYATGSRTTRGLEAILHGFPPLPGIALNQRAGFERLPSLPRALGNAGFDTLFVYGGWPGFSGFARYWRGIGFATVTSREDFLDAGFQTSWGVTDETLFARVLEEMDARTAAGRRVFLATLTVSNHRPFDFPAGRIDFPADERRLEYAIAYADWALGEFLDAAAHRSWFADTLFVVVADHGPKPRAAGPVPIESFRVPAVLLWEAGLAPRTVEPVSSLMDLPRTLAGLLGVATTEAFFGRDLLSRAPAPCAGAPVEYGYRPGWIGGAGLTVLERYGEPAAFVRERAGNFAPVAVREGDVRCAIAVFETGLELWRLRKRASAAAP